MQLLLSGVIGLALVIDGAVLPPLYEQNRVWSLSTADPILKIGTAITLDVNSKHFSYGRDMSNAWTLYFDWYFRTFGAVMVNGTQYSVKLMLIDDQSDENQTAADTKQLLEVEGVRHFFGPYSTALAGISAKLISDAGGISINSGASGVSVYKGRKGIFGMSPPNSQWLNSTFRALAAADGGSRKTVMSVMEDISWSQTICGTIPALAKENNMEILEGTISVPESAGEEEIGGVVRRFSTMLPDIVIACTYPFSCRALLNQMRTRRYSPKALHRSIVLKVRLGSRDPVNSDPELSRRLEL